MSEKTPDSSHAWIVTFAGTGINLALGVLYAWSVISKQITKEWGWNETQAALPYSIAIALFAFMMVPAGRLQDKMGPRLTASLGGIFCGVGFLIASLGQSLVGMVIGFGILAGTGIGFGYASATPAAVKWFPPQRTGLIAGLVVAGFGLASVYIAPLANYLLNAFGIQSTFLILGIAFLVIVVVLAQFMKNPPSGYKPEANPAVHPKAGGAPKPAAKKVDYEWHEMLRTPQFYLLWIMFMFAAGAGLMIIGKLAKIVDLQAGIKAGFVFVALLAVGNAGGRIVAGVLSDKIGRTWTMFIVFIFQAILMFLLRGLDTYGTLFLASILIGFNYGANLSVFPSAVKDYFGLKNFGFNYGCVFTAWGAGGILGPLLSGWIYDSYKNFNHAYLIASVCLILAAVLTFVTRPPKRKEA
ncbi:MAG: OFA family MFS transporter [Deltaproteobacteria bacterium]|nr:OFA family MFS transporter [Deltaproteobacteria bacterium]